jgi:hypothetical protein
VWLRESQGRYKAGVDVQFNVHAREVRGSQGTHEGLHYHLRHTLWAGRWYGAMSCMHEVHVLPCQLHTCPCIWRAGTRLARLVVTVPISAHARRDPTRLCHVENGRQATRACSLHAAHPTPPHGHSNGGTVGAPVSRVRTHTVSEAAHLHCHVPDMRHDCTCCAACVVTFASVGELATTAAAVVDFASNTPDHDTGKRCTVLARKKVIEYAVCTRRQQEQRAVVVQCLKMASSQRHGLISRCLVGPLFCSVRTCQGRLRDEGQQ